MSKPVVVDDGGSVRIREMEDGVRMDGLLDPPGAPVVSNQNFTDLTGAFQCTLTVRYFDEEGVLLCFRWREPNMDWFLRRTTSLPSLPARENKQSRSLSTETAF